MRKATKTLHFPLSGVSRNLSFRESVTPDNEQKVYGTPDAMNVRGDCTFLDRARGGSRPGLKRLVGVAAEATGKWAWPSGEPIEWPGDAGHIGFDLATTKYVAPDGTRIADPHRTVLAQASKGDAPESPTATCTYRARVVAAKGAMWYASRTGDAGDWDYGAYSEDPGRATAGSVALASEQGDEITALIPIADKWLYVATRRSLWLMSGEPTSGSLVRVSEGVGCCGANAWCYDGRHLWLLSYQGVFTVDPGAAHPIHFSYRVPQLKGTDADALMVADHEKNAVMLLSASAGSWHIDKAAKSLWPFTFANAAHKPLAAAHVLVGGKNKTAFRCADGNWRYFDDEAADDDGTPIASRVLLGPFRLSDSDAADGLFAELYATLAAGSADVKVEVFTGRSPEEAVPGTDEAGTPSFVVTDGWNPVIRPRARGAWCVIRLSSNGRWGYESAYVANKALGRLRP